MAELGGAISMDNTVFDYCYYSSYCYYSV